MHIAGRAPEIQLPIVAELMNAAEDKAALTIIRAAETSGTPVAMSGAWRLWCEHGGTSDQIQGATLKPFTTTNPDHCFEIHPITKVGNRETGDSFHPIDPGFKTKDAETAFTAYEAVRSELIFDGRRRTTTLHTNGIGFNYVEFIIELNETPTFKTADGGMMVFAEVQTLDDELLIRKRRMVFAPDTAPLARLPGLQKCDRLRVLGIPRINLAIVSWRTSHRADRPEVLRWNLPYEMIIAAVYDDKLERLDDCTGQ
jgi:hypothetical protein